jgi:pimeloyl-ACP methyl ester carboxylesterase
MFASILMPMRSQKIALGTGLSYHLLEWGAEEPHDHTVLLLHGFLDLAWGWRPTVEAGLAGRFHVIAPDMRGHGDSDRVGAGGYYYFLDYLADVHELVQKMGRDKLSIVGHSMGGSIASYYTGSFPARVHKLALLEGLGPPPMAPPGPERVQVWLSGWERVRNAAPRSYASVEEAAARLREHDSLLGADLALELAQHGTVDDGNGRRRFKHDPLHATQGPYGIQLDWAMRFWRAITCPVLLVEGDQSEFRALATEERIACFARAQCQVLPGAGHMMQRHQPVALARILTDFLTSS